MADESLSSFLSRKNEKVLFTPGPGPLLLENLLGLSTGFGRNDDDYAATQEAVVRLLQHLTGRKTIVALQGSGALAIEIMLLNFAHGRVALVDTGFYSSRMLKTLRAMAPSVQVETFLPSQISSLVCSGPKFDWVVAAPVETSRALLTPIAALRELADSVGAKLMLDATASIGLESDHEMAEAMAFSSCKGLFGLTGACFVAFDDLRQNQVDSFYLNVETHKRKSVTPPIHTICSLAKVLPDLGKFREAVKANKSRMIALFGDDLVHDSSRQPLLCTWVSRDLRAAGKEVIIYRPREPVAGTIVSHLGEAHLGLDAQGEILNVLVSDK